MTDERIAGLSRDLVECVAKAAAQTRRRYAELNNEASGVDQMIYGEICDAFEDFAYNLRAEMEKNEPP